MKYSTAVRQIEELLSSQSHISLLEIRAGALELEESKTMGTETLSPGRYCVLSLEVAIPFTQDK